jgi:nicotinate-nucleotide adenylyltransferase
MNSQSKRIGLFGGTFDPVHNGHISAAKSFLASDIIDSLWILLNPDPPHKKRDDFAPYTCRFQMLKNAFKSIKNIKISDLETDLPKPLYTVQTIQYLTNACPEAAFYLCIGYDSYADFKSWHQWEQILELARLLVVNRPGNNQIPEDHGLIDHATFVEHQPVQVSSSEIRAKIARGESAKGLTPPSVLSIIKNNDLYK